MTSRAARRLTLVPPWLVAAAMAGLYLVIAPDSADLAAQVYRVELFERHGFAAWDNAWYGGHHLPGYSVLFPPLGALLGPRVVGALSAVAAAFLFERLVVGRYGRRARIGALWFAAATATNLLTGRLAFGLGVCLALGALLIAVRGHRTLGTASAALAALASPVAGLFLGLAAVAWWLADRTGAAVGPAIGAGAAVAALTVAFPEGGIEPFVASSFWPAFLLVAAVLIALPPRERVLRVGAVLYLAAILASFVLDTPMGGNVTRLGTLFAGPVLACAALAAAGPGMPRAVFALIVLAAPLVQFQWGPAVRDWRRAHRDPSIQRSYYEGLLAFLAQRRAREDGPFRVEIPFTENHWEARHVAPSFPLARGWQRQLDVRDNALFYRPRLTPAVYRAWLEDNGVRYVALPDVDLDYSARAEARIIRSRPPFLRPVWRDRRWRVYAVPAARPLAVGARMVDLGTQHFELVAPRPTTAVVRVRFTPYWNLDGLPGCVSRARGGWTRVRLARGGRARVSVRFAPARVVSRGPRCTAG
jgi:hypothetical protein